MKKQSIYLSIYSKKSGEAKQPVKCEAYILEKGGVAFGIHRPLNQNKGWTVTELRGGSCMRIFRRTIKQCEAAITDELIYRINVVYSNDKYFKKISKTIEKAYKDADSPLYKKIYC